MAEAVENGLATEIQNTIEPAVQNTSEKIENDVKPIIYVTGFEPFPPHAVNASEKAVEQLRGYGLEQELGVQLELETMKVDYCYVTKTIPLRWQALKPKLVVHVGVSSQASTLVLEQVAHNCGYNRKDNCGTVPHKEICVAEGTETITSGLRMELVSREVNQNTGIKLPAAKSTDPGRYLCDFIYYTSLHQDKSRVAFIHVPTLAKSPVEETAAAIALAIRSLYRQVVENDANLAAEMSLRE